MSSIAQDELGHAAALYGLLGELTGTDPDALAYDREPDEYRHCRLLDHGRGDWAMTIARRFLYDTSDVVRLEALADGVVGAAGRARRQAAARGALPPDARRARGWSGWPGARASRATACWPRSPSWRPDAATVFTPLDGEAALARRRDPGRADGRARGALARVDRADFAALDLPMPPPATRPGARPARPRRAVPMAVGRVHHRPPLRPRSDLVSEAGIADRDRTARAGAIVGRRASRPRPAAGRRGRRPRRPGRGDGPGAADAVRRRPRDRPSRRGRRRTTARSGSRSCRPSSAARRSSSSRRRSPTGSRPSAGRSRSRATFEVPWTSDRISPAGRAALAAAGIAPPAPGADGRSARRP